MISALESIISEYDNVEEIFSDNGKQHSLAVTRGIDNIGAVSQEAEICWAWYPCYHHPYSSSQYGYSRHPIR